ncbi:MAG: ACP S-malonyltransferase [Candidatus Omnitrophica bacterium]|nr:ACP S-malonyltransferase [Candidatus Omnitrophota bacterium]MBU4457198.1 ACP S-malonyltransferase [Candidatus Omnitrophota bacterium]
MKIAYLFPGQGAQYVGMGKDFYEDCPESKKIFDEVENILPNVPIKKLCFEGPIEELTQTANSQVCILVTSIAALKALYSRNADNGIRTTVQACAGLSLGELTSLVAAQAIGFPDAVRLVRRRGELMEEASQKNPGSMASIIGLALNDLKEACKEGKAEIANLNCPGQIVISGTKGSVEATMAIAAEKGAKKAIPLKVSGGFHSSLMKEAADVFKIELDKVRFTSPQIGVISNVTADYEKTPEEIKVNLVKQLTSPVRWEESIRKIAGQGVDTFFEIGPGKVLKGLLRRIDPVLKVYNLEKMKDLNIVTRNQ